MASKQNPGAPHEVGSMSEKQFPVLMACHLSVRYEENQHNAVPDMLYQVDKRLMRMLLSVVSNVADRSTRLSAVTLLLSLKANVIVYF